MTTTHKLLLLALAAQAALVAPAAAAPIASAAPLPAPVEHGDWNAVPADCRQFLDTPVDARGDFVAWEQRISLAACEEPRMAPITATDPTQLQQVISDLDRAVQPTVALYRDAIARGPLQIKMLAAAGLGMAYMNVVVLARGSIAAPPDLMTNIDSADHYVAMHQAIEPMLDSLRGNAKAAFAKADQLAASDPARAAANQVMVHAMMSAHTKREQLATR